MGAKYTRGIIGRINKAKLKAVTIGIGGDILWQGGVDLATQLKLLAFLQDCEARFPVDKLPPPDSDDEPSPSANVTGHAPPPATAPIPAAKQTVPHNANAAKGK
jgi:hypothetical protein